MCVCVCQLLCYYYHIILMCVNILYCLKQWSPLRCPWAELGRLTNVVRPAKKRCRRGGGGSPTNALFTPVSNFQNQFFALSTILVGTAGLKRIIIIWRREKGKTNYNNTEKNVDAQEQSFSSETHIHRRRRFPARS